MKEYNTVQVTKKSPFKAPKTVSSLQTPPANKVCKSTMMQVFCFGVFMCVFVCVKWNTEHKCSFPHASSLAAITWEAGTTKKTPPF